jgi:transcriptional regulator of nitric oxide reductase/ferredoxin
LRTHGVFLLLAFTSLCLLLSAPTQAALLDRDALAAKVEPPYELGSKLNDNGVWSIQDRTGVAAGYIFETEPLAPLPGFSGAAINVLVTLDRDGRFLKAELIEHNEPIFVSGLGQAPFHEFMRQYRGLSIFDSITVGVPYGEGDQDGSGQVYLDGVTKATASVRIAHESILAASLAVAREQMQGLAGGPAPSPKRGDDGPTLDWNALVEQGIATRRTITNAELQAAFDDTLWEDDDEQALADPDGDYLDLWVIDIGPDAIARAVLDEDTLDERDALLSVAEHDEPLLLLANGRHGLVSDEFVRNTSPDLLLAEQGGLPVALRDADVDVGTAAGVPDFEHRMMLRTDRRLGFDPTRDWDLVIRAIRRHGSFMPEVGVREFRTTQSTPADFFDVPTIAVPRPVWIETALARRVDLAILGSFLILLTGTLLFRQRWLAVAQRLRPYRLGILAFTLIFIGWWGQGQLSIVTVIGTLRAAVEGTGFLFLLYDPFSLLVWAAAIIGFVLWGRGLFCGWLCPYGALQEFADRLGRLLGIKRRRMPERADRKLKLIKYVLLAVLIVSGFVAPVLNDTLVEVEPFKTAITVGFMREWWFAAYALGWLVLGMLWFKPFCRYVCPLGAFMALGGVLRLRRWIPRRDECGSPCQLCKVQCQYDAIKKEGEIAYSECFQCLDCVSIHDDSKQCVPLILETRREARVTFHNAPVASAYKAGT